MKNKISVPIEIKIEIEKNVRILKDLLQDNKEFAKILLDNSLLLGKDQGVYTGNIDSLIAREYSNLDEYGAFRGALAATVWKLGKLIYGNDSLITKEIMKNPEEEWRDYSNKFRNEVERIVKDVFYLPDPDIISTNLSGESIQFNDF